MKRHTILVLCAVLAVTAAAFWPSLRNGFTNWDDNEYVLENPWIRGWSADNLWAIWTQSRAANYHPLVFMTHLAEHSLWGLRPAGYHAVNLLLHLAATLFVFAFVKRLLTLGGSDPRFALGAAGFAGLAFGIHPLRVESVAWIAERKDVLCGALFMLAIWLYLGQARRHWARFPGAAFSVYILACLAKSMAVTWPVMTILCDLYLKRPRTRRWWMEKTLFIAPAVLIAIVTWLVQSQKRGIQPEKLGRLWDNAQSACHAAVFYLWKVVAPVNLSAFYSHPDWGITPAKTAAAAAILLLLALLAALAWRRGDRLLPLAVGWYLITLLPVSSLVPLGFTFAADRYLYLPAVGLFLLLGYGLTAAAFHSGRSRLVLAAWGAMLVAGLAPLTWARCGVWQNGETLWLDTVRTAPNHLTYRMLGMAQMDMGKLREAEASMRISLAHSETQYGRHYMGEVMRLQGRHQEAAEWYARFLKEQDWYVPALTGYGLSLMALDRAPEATDVFVRCANREPGSPVHLANLGWSLLAQARHDEAREVLDAALALDPRDPMVNYNSGVLRMRQENYREAETFYRRTLEKQPDNRYALVNLGLTLRLQSRYNEARAPLQRALDLAPGDPVALEELAKLPAP